jgi:hypothetical protein
VLQHVLVLTRFESRSGKEESSDDEAFVKEGGGRQRSWITTIVLAILFILCCLFWGENHHSSVSHHQNHLFASISSVEASFSVQNVPHRDETMNYEPVLDHAAFTIDSAGKAEAAVEGVDESGEAVAPNLESSMLWESQQKFASTVSIVQQGDGYGSSGSGYLDSCSETDSSKDYLWDGFSDVKSLSVGPNSSVYSAKWDICERNVIVKVVSGEKGIEELKCLQKVNGIQGIVKLLDYKVGQLGKVALILEVAPGVPLVDLKGRCLHVQVRDILCDLLRIVLNLYQACPGCVHGDVKLANVMYDPESKTVTLLDMGSVVSWTAAASKGVNIDQSVMPPEVCNGTVNVWFVQRIDSWCIAVLAFDLLMLFGGGRRRKCAADCSALMRQSLEAIPELAFLASCLADNPKSRPNVEDIANKLRQ